MQMENELNAKILKITLAIGSDFPELLDYLNEMPVTIPDVPSPEMNKKALFEYYNSLESILTEYLPNHQ